MKLEVTAQQRANALEALNVMWPSVPPKNVSPRLRNFTENENDETNCGTVACFGGWCARWPNFIAQGGAGTSCGYPVLNDGAGYVNAMAIKLFGVSAWPLFDAREGHEDGTDHQIVSKRLRKLIRESVVV